MPRKATSKKTQASVKKEVKVRKTKSPSRPIRSPRKREITPLMEKTTPTNISSTNLREKIKNPKLLIGIAVVVILLALIYFFRSQFVVAFVNGQPISRMAFNKQLEQQDGKQVLNTLITTTLIEQEASKKHISISQSEIDAQAKQIDQQLNKQGQGLDSALAAQGMTRPEFYDQLRLQTLVQKLLGNSIKVSDKEVNDYIAAHQDSIDPNAKPEDTQASVRQQLEQQKLSEQAQALIAKLQQQAHITYFVSF